VLLDDGEEVAEEAPLLVGQFRALDGRLGLVLDAVDLAPCARQQDRAGRAPVGAATALAVGPVGARAALSRARGTAGRGFRPA
jgi:hypothetical protein